MFKILTLIAIATAFTSLSLAFPQGGAPVCLYNDTTQDAMQAVHGAGVAPLATLVADQTGASSYQISLNGITSYKGLILYVRGVNNSTHVGTFDFAGLADVGLRGKDCTSMSGASSGNLSTIGHFQSNDKTNLTFTWSADAAVTSGMQLVAEAVVVVSEKNWFLATPSTFVVAVVSSPASASASASPTAAAATVTDPAGIVTTAPVTSPTSAASPAGSGGVTSKTRKTKMTKSKKTKKTRAKKTKTAVTSGVIVAPATVALTTSVAAATAAATQAVAAPPVGCIPVAAVTTTAVAVQNVIRPSNLPAIVAW